MRFASSSAAASGPKPTVPAQSPTSRGLAPQLLAKLNPPPETYAPDLSIPAKTPAQNYPTYMYQCGKLYVQFYKQGISNVRATSKIAKALRQKLEREKGKSSDAKKDAGGLSILTRAEWQIVRRSRADMMRLPAFGVLVIVLGEWLALLAMYLTPVIPEPCRIPAQIRRQQEKAQTRRRERERQLALHASRIVARDRGPGSTARPVVPQAVSADKVDGLDLYSLMSLSARLDSHSGFWDWLRVTPPKALLRSAVRKRIEYLRSDDGLIERDGGWQSLNAKEVERACVERGVDVLGKKEDALRKELAAWFKR